MFRFLLGKGKGAEGGKICADDGTETSRGHGT
jgi:hypothetical protein